MQILLLQDALDCAPDYVMELVSALTQENALLAEVDVKDALVVIADVMVVGVVAAEDALLKVAVAKAVVMDVRNVRQHALQDVEDVMEIAMEAQEDVVHAQEIVQKAAKMDVEILVRILVKQTPIYSKYYK